MKDFLKPNIELKKKKSTDKVDYLIDRFNKLISKEYSERYSLNTGLDNIPILSKDEFSLAQSKANENGFNLISVDDNYNTFNYILTIQL